VSPDPASFEVVGSDTLIDVGFVALSETHVEGRGASFSRYVVHHPGAVVVVPVESDGDTVILVRQFRASTGRELLEVPAGKRDVEGEAPEETGRRELIEEIGRKPGRLVPLCEFYNSPGFCDEHSFVFMALDLEPCASSAQGIEEQHMTIERVSFDEVMGLIVSGALVDAKSLIGLSLARVALGS
jgi:8-oxo-dGTP pyrophosphatase MutT (NUDIX family)